MSNSPLEVLEYGEQIAKRAQWEAFEFTILREDSVEVVNTSYDNPDDTRYNVHVEGSIPSDCSCPPWEYQEGACKHMVGVAIPEPVLKAVSTEPRMKADGGVTVEADESDHSDGRLDDCDCSLLFESLSCWPCYRDGFEEPNPRAEVNNE